MMRFYSTDFTLLISSLRKNGIFHGKGSNALQKARNGHPRAAGIQQELFDLQKRYKPSPEEVDDTFQKVEVLTSRLKLIIEEAASKNYIREEFILSLRVELKKHYYLIGSPFVVAINNLIAAECEKYRYIKLSAEERVMLWNE